MITEFLKNKIIPVALISALVGGLAGSALTFNGSSAQEAFNTSDVALSADQTLDRIENTIENQSADDSVALSSNLDNPLTSGLTGRDIVSTSRVSTSNGTNQAYYRQANNSPGVSAKSNAYDGYANHTATQPRRERSRSFWQKHRDKLTVAGGTGVGAALGAAFGGKKGALIGALAGGGGSALYTYKIRKRN